MSGMNKNAPRPAECIHISIHTNICTSAVSVVPIIKPDMAQMLRKLLFPNSQVSELFVTVLILQVSFFRGQRIWIPPEMLC